MAKPKSFSLRKILHFCLAKFMAGFAFGVVVVAAGSSAAYGGWKILEYAVAPNMENFLSQKAPASTLIKDKNGSVLYEYYSENKRRPVRLKNISQNLISATLAAEDKTFFEHNGIWLSSILRAAFLNTYFGQTLHGGSTITQQLVKNVILTNEKSTRRKLAEIVWSVKLEHNLSKSEILENYLNLVPYGQNTAGAEAAAQNFFNKPASELSLAESAYLAALPKAPSRFSDAKYFKDLETRKNYILDLMAEIGFISHLEAATAQAQQLHFSTGPKNKIRAPHFVFLALEEIKNTLGQETLKKGGLVVQTTLDLNLQNTAEQTMVSYMTEAKKKFNAHNASLVGIDPKTGSILVYIGSKDYFALPEPFGCASGKTCTFDPQTDINTSLRQTGSSFKPYVYATAFGEDFKMSPATLVADVSRTFRSSGGAYSPRNYSGTTYGKLPARKALAGSLNVAAVNVLADIGIEPVIKTLRKLGVGAPFENCGLAMALGACEMTPLEHTAGFAGLANLGKFNSEFAIQAIKNFDTEIIYEHKSEPVDAVNPAAAFELMDVLSDNTARSFIFGSKSPLAFTDKQVAVKTGTTQNWKDGWTIGGNSDFVLGVWIGNNNGQLMTAGADGVLSAAPLWRKIIDLKLGDFETQNFIEPFGISRVAIDSRTGKILNPKPGQKLEPIADYALKIETPKISKPKVLGISKPSLPNNNDGDTKNQETTVILEPWANQVITKTPFDVKVYVGTSTQATTVELKFDGQTIASKSESPFLFTLPQNLQNGTHTLTATATHFDLLESSYTIKFKTMFNPPPVVPRGQKIIENKDN